ncbi:PBECR3 domain-containing polyvalent protein, partial [Helicobacter bizzozeronii]|uniref:PBECR3 domain-containing polyvalent protein n=1 Tax=Helicobacter bizzozeronii TaxID=56877 RepID=UPI00131591B6
GALSLVGDAVFKGVAKSAQSLKPLASLVGRGVDYIPFVGASKRFMSGNVQAAQKVLAEVYTPEQEQALKEFANHFGGGVKLNAQPTGLNNRMKAQFGEDSKIYKAYQSVEDIFRLTKQSEQQEAFIRAIRADESGTLLAFLIEAGNSSPKAHNTLKGILNKTTQNLEEQLQQLHLKPTDIKAIFEDLEKGTKESYADVTERLIPQVLGDLKTTLNPNQAKQIRQEFINQGLDLEAQPFLKQIEHNIYNKEGVTFTQLNNALKTLNSYYKNTPNPTLKDHIRKLSDNIIRNDIQEGISQLFKQLPEGLGSKYQELFNTALKDYATMKETLKIIDKGSLKLRDVARSEQRALDALIKYTQGQGAEGLDNLSRITKGLSPANREVLELNMLNRLFATSLHQLEGLKVFDSQAFFKHLDTLKAGTFQSKAAQDFIEIASGFNKLFNQDAKLAQALKSTTGEQVGSSIATSVWGAVQYQITKFAFALMVRTMPHIPFFKGINTKVSSAALRYHIKAALNKSASVQDFKIQLNHLVQRQDFDNATKALIREIEGGLPPDDGGGGALPSPKDTPISGEGNNKPPKGNDGHMGKEGNGELISKTTPTRKATKEDLTQEFLEEVKRRKNDKVWVGDLTNPQIIQHLGFDPNKPIKMLFDGDALTHIEKRHGEGSPLVESSGQPAVKLEDIQNYPDIVNHADLMRVVDTPKGKYFLAGKQINGYVAVVEAVGVKNNQLMLKTMYKERGKLADSKEFKESISNHNVADSRPLNTGDSLDTAMDLANSSTTPLNLEAIPAKATELFNTAKEQEIGFRGLLESLTQPSSSLEAGNLLKSVESIQSKLERKQGRVESLNDLLRGAIIAKDREVIDDQLTQIAIKLRDAQIPHTIEYKENRGSGYEGIHIHFKHNDVSAEIQVHTPKNWAIKKQQDEKYHIIREEEINPTLGEEELKKLKEESKVLGQDSDLDIKLLTSFEVISTESTSAMSLNLKNAPTDSNLTHILRLKSNSKEPPPSKDANAYKRPDSELNQNDNLSSGSGNIITPLEKNTKPPLKTPNIEPNPAFGEHFKEFEGKGAQAVAKLLKEQRGQVAGAFYREDLGYIDLVWGDSKKGLAHILERRTQQYGEQQALEFVNDLPRMLQEAKFWREIEDKIELVTPTDMIVLGKRGDNKFVLTSFRDRRSKDRFKELENPQTGDDVGFTGKSVSEPQTKDDVLLPNQTDSTTTPQ